VAALRDRVAAGCDTAHASAGAYEETDVNGGRLIAGV
jgi:hypothetical protein